MAKTKKYAFGGALKSVGRAVRAAKLAAPKPAAPKPYIPPKLPGVRARPPQVGRTRPSVPPPPSGFKPMPPGVVPRAPEQGPSTTAFNTIANGGLGVAKGLMGMKKGGTVNSSASKRADGIATKGKTKGKMV